MDKKVLVIAKSQRQFREFFTLMDVGKRMSPKSFPINPEDLQSVGDYGLHLKSGVVMEKTAANLSQLTNHIAIAFQLKLVGEGSGQVFHCYERDADTANMLSGIINELGNDDDRKCKYICDLTMAFPKWAVTDLRFPPMIVSTTSADGSIIKGDLKSMFGPKTLENERIDFKHSNLLMDHVFIPNAHSNQEATILGTRDIKHRYLFGVLGRSIQDLVELLSKYEI